MLEDLESQAASELESYGDATFGAEWTGKAFVVLPVAARGRVVGAWWAPGGHPLVGG